MSRSGIAWRAEILQEADAPFTRIGTLEFDADEAIKIDWTRRDKEDVICGSCATLRIISPGDRTYEDLYSIEVGRVRLDVYRNNVLYWSGTIDPEFYEEPYESKDNYDVSITFSDFGVLDRLSYNAIGINSIQAIIASALRRCKLNYRSLDFTSYCSTKFTDDTAATIGAIAVRSDNFYDEDGEASTLKETIEGVLQPLGLKMIQKAGTVYIFDLNGLYENAPAKLIEWDGIRQTMGTDKVVNNVKVTWNTYAQTGNLLPEECWTEKTDATQIAMNALAGRTIGESTIFSFHYSTDLYDWIDATDAGFTIWLNRNGKNATLDAPYINFFKIVEQYDGKEGEGVALYFRSYRGYKVGSGGNWQANVETRGNGLGIGSLAGNLSTVRAKLFSSLPVWVPPVNSPGALMLRITANLLVDPRFNPFETAANLMEMKRVETGLEQKDQYDTWNTHGNFVYVPVTIKFRPDGSNDVYCWTNTDIVSRSVDNPVKSLSETYGRWVRYNESEGDDVPPVWGYLCYYDKEDRQEKCGVLGWRKNRPAINPHDGKFISILKNAENGQYMPYPNFGGAGGSLWVEVRAGGWIIADANNTLSATEVMNPGNLWNKISWILMQLPEVEIMNNTQFDQPINADDVEYSSYVNPDAKEALEIDTICGSSAEGVPTARGAYYRAATGKQITELKRAGRTGQIEDLLLGTLYSQYATRKTRLEGETVIDPTGLNTYAEQNQAGKKFVILGEVQNLIQDTADPVFVELAPDEYDKTE